VLKNVLERDQFTHQTRQELPHDKEMLQAYLHTTVASHGYLLLDLSQDKDDSLSFRTCISPKEAPSKMYVDIGNEKHKGKLSHYSRTKTCLSKIT